MDPARTGRRPATPPRLRARTTVVLVAAVLLVVVWPRLAPAPPQLPPAGAVALPVARGAAEAPGTAPVRRSPIPVPPADGAARAARAAPGPEVELLGPEPETRRPRPRARRPRTRRPGRRTRRGAPRRPPAVRRPAPVPVRPPAPRPVAPPPRRVDADLLP